MLDRLGIAELAARPVETLSGGERQRVVLSRALLQSAPIVVLDEPTTALDIGHQQDVLELVDELRSERGLTVVSTMHDLTLAGLFADELVLLDNGRVAERGPADTVLTEAHLRDHFGARVSVLAGEDGPVVVPARLRRRAQEH
jgi:iron complex transport system ATP-binding protein